MSSRLGVFLGLLGVLAPACYETDSVVCGELLCPTAKVCAPDGVTCVAPDQIASCAALPDGAACAYPGTPEGICASALCVPLGCGNSVVEPGEACDDGNRTSFDGCRSDCLTRERCGDGVAEPALGEQCDCGETGSVSPICSGPNSAEITASCRLDCLPARCGDAIVGVDELCDDGNTSYDDGCRGDCQGRFRKMQTPTTGVLHEVYAASPTNVYVTSDVGLLHYDGVTWSVTPIPNVIGGTGALWANGPDDLYVTTGAAVHHFNGTTWQAIPLPGPANVTSVWAASPSEIWIGSSFTSLLSRYNGTTWSTVPWCSGGGVSSPNDIIKFGAYVMVAANAGLCAYGPTDILVHTQLTRGLALTATSVVGIGPSALVEWTGPGPTMVRTVPGNLSAIVALPQEILLAGNQGAILRFANNVWTSLPAPTEHNLRSVSATSSTNVFVIGEVGTILH